jgi:hypothetical protein
MIKAISRVLFTAFMLIAFVGQAIAYNSAMSCETLENAALVGDHTNTSAQEQLKSLVASDSKNSEDCCGIDCCDLDCNCIANACSSFMYVETESYVAKNFSLNEAVWWPLSNQPITMTSLLYRPPIFIS